jgi:hypothetical protein
MNTPILAAIRCSLMFTSPKLSFARSIPCSLFAIALMAWSPLQTRADTIAFSISGGGLFRTAVDGTFGYSFTLSSAVTVTHLGLFDFGNDGLITSHAVTIWTSTGTQLIQTTIPAGTGGTLLDGFRYVSIAPLTLTAGTYTIGGFYAALSEDRFLSFVPSITGASGVSYGGSRSADGFVFPIGNVFGFPNGWFGPNFEFTTGVPTPDSGSTVSLLGFGLLGLAALRRKLGC